MKSIKKYFLLLFILSVFLFGVIYAKNAVADWKNDHRNPVISITATCSDGNPIVNNGTCRGASATIAILYTDNAPNDSGLKSISHTLNGTTEIINFGSGQASHNYTYSSADVNNTTAGQYDVSASATDYAGNISGNGIPTTFAFNFLYSVQGTVFVDDVNSNGLFEPPGETPYMQSSPSIDVSISGHTTTILKGVPYNGSYNYKIDDLAVAGTPYTITQVPPGSYVNTLPQPSIYSIMVGPGCVINGNSYGATCTIGGNIQNLNFGIRQTVPWFQGTGGDLRVDSSIGSGPGFNDSLPSGGNCGGSDYPSDYASIFDSRNPDTDFSDSPGVIFSGDTTVNPSFGGGQASQQNWVVGGVSASWPETFKPVQPGVIRTSYSYYKRTIEKNFPPTYPIPLSTAPATCSAGGLSSCTLPIGLPNGVYTADSNVTLNGWIPTSGNYLFLINGDLTINGNIIIKVGSTATFSVSGNIIVDKNVGVPLASCNETTQTGCICDVTSLNQNNCNIEGFYSTDNSFIINNRADVAPVGACGAGGAQKDYRLNIAGSIVVNAGLKQTPGTLQNNRDLCNGNAICPAFAVIERPDFILNAPDIIKHPNFVWQEIAP